MASLTGGPPASGPLPKEPPGLPEKFAMAGLDQGAGLPASGDAGPREPPKVAIKVITVDRTLADLATASQEQLMTIFAEIGPALALAETEGRAKGPSIPPDMLDPFLGIAAHLQGRIAPFLAWAWEPIPEGALDAILARELVANPAVRPVIVERPGPSAGDRSGGKKLGARAEPAGAVAVAPATGAAPAAVGPGGLLTRAARQTRAIDLAGRDISLAAEEPVVLWGFAVDPLAAGEVMFLESAHLRFGYPTLAICGTYTAALLAAAGPIHPSEGPRPAEAPGGPDPGPATLLTRRGFQVAPVSPGDPRGVIRELLRQSRAAVGYYESGAAAMVALSLVEAAATSRPGAPELSELAPRYGALTGPSVVEVARGAARHGPHTWRSPRAAAALRSFLVQLARTEPIAASAEETWAFDLSPLQDMYRAGALFAWLDALTEGLEGGRIPALLERLGLRLAQALHEARLSSTLAKEAARARLYVLIAEDRFGSARAGAIFSALQAASASAKGAPGGSLALPEDAVRVDNPDTVLELLSPAERGVVAAEYERRLEEWAGSVGNRCPHVRIARRLRAARDARDALRGLAELSRFFAPPAHPGGRDPKAREDWLMCRNCGHRALCPHVRARIEMEARRAPHEAIRTRLQAFSVRAPGAEAELFVHYCRLCGERLAEIRDDDVDPSSVLGRYGELDAGLRSRVWSLASTAARQVRFPVPTDERVFASSVAAVVFPLLLAAEDASGRKRRPAADRSRPAGARPRSDDEPDDDAGEVDPLMLVDAVLFVYAYVLELIRATQSLRSREVGFAGVKLGSKLHVYGDAILRHVASAHRNLLARAEDVTNEYLRARFTEAFRLVQREGGVGAAAPGAAERPEVELAIQTTTMDPIYRYAVTVARVAGALPAGSRPGDPDAAKREFETALGNSLPAIIKVARESAKDPALAALYLRRTGLEVPPGGTLDQLLKDPRVNLHAGLYEPPAELPGHAAAEAFRALGKVAGGAGELGGKRGSPSGAPREGILAWTVETTDRGGTPRRGPKGPERPEGPPTDRFEGGKPHRGPKGPKRPEGPPTDRKEGATGGPRLRLRSAPPAGELAAATLGGYFAAYRLFARYTRGVPPGELDSWKADMAEYRRCEAGLREAIAADSLKSYSAVPFAATQQFVPPSRLVTLAHLYDEDGAKHVWSGGGTTYYYRAGTGEPVEIRGGSKAVKRARDSGQLTPVMALEDLGCPVCGVRASEVESLDLAAVAASVRRVAEIGAFFIFYETRCPRGDIHDMGPGPNGLQCRRCGLEAGALSMVADGRAARDPVARAYYDRYRQQFVAARRQARGRARDAAPAPRPQDTRPVAAPAAAPFLADYTLVVRAAELAGTSPAAIEAIGSTEGREYSQVLEGKGAPLEPTSPSDPRIYDADAEARFFLSEYARLRHYSRFVKPPPAAGPLLSAAGVPASEFPNLSEVLPDVGAGYSAELAAARGRLGPPELLAFIVQSLCRFALDVAAAKSSAPGREWVSRLGQAFAQKTLQQILTNQRLLSKPGAFNWTIFVEDDESFDQDQVGDVGEDVLAELLDAAGEEAPDDPFSGAHIDYDTSEDNPNNEGA